MAGLVRARTSTGSIKLTGVTSSYANVFSQAQLVVLRSRTGWLFVRSPSAGAHHRNGIPAWGSWKRAECLCHDSRRDVSDYSRPRGSARVAGPLSRDSLPLSFRFILFRFVLTFSLTLSHSLPNLHISLFTWR